MKRVPFEQKQQALIDLEQKQEHKNNWRPFMNVSLDSVNYKTALLSVMEDLIFEEYDEAMDDIFQIIDIDDEDVRKTLEKMGVRFEKGAPKEA